MITGQLLRQALPTCRDPEGWTGALSPAMQAHEISTPMRAASFLAQTAYESQNFNRLEEGLTYKTAKRLMEVWPKRFPTEGSAMPYVDNPSGLANFVYADRMGNGSSASGDGYRYRGRGLMQTTGRSNYETASKALGLDLIGQPELLGIAANAAMSAAFFWQSRGLNALADDRTDDDDLEDFTTITVRINGGKAGLQGRFALFKTFEGLLVR